MPEHGYQGKENPQEIYRKGIKDLGGFASLPVEEQIKKLTAIEKTRFFQLLRTHTIEGMFSDPMHGGNAGLIGWQLVGYPGPQMSYRNDIDKAFLGSLGGRNRRVWNRLWGVRESLGKTRRDSAQGCPCMVISIGKEAYVDCRCVD